MLLRALLRAVPPGVCTLPEGCSSLDEIDLASVKVQALLNALDEMRPVDLNDVEFRCGQQVEGPLVGPLEGGEGRGAAVEVTWHRGAAGRFFRKDRNHHD